MNKASISKGDAFILLSTAFWGTISIFTRWMLAEEFTSVQIVTIRAFITTLTMLVVLLIKQPSLLKIRLRDIWMFIGSGICSFMFFNICYMSSIGENSVSVACILMYTSPIWVTLMSALVFKERLTPGKLAALAICFGGSAMVCLSGSLNFTPIGLLFGLGSGIGYALYSIFGKLASSRYSTLTVIFYTFLFSTIGCSFICDIPKTVTLLSVPENLLMAVGISILCTVIPYLLYTYGLSKSSASKASILSITEPVVAAIVGIIAFAEMPGILGFLGMAVVLAGLILLEKLPSEVRK